MATILTTRGELASNLSAQISGLRALASQCRAYDRLRKKRLADGTTPLATKTEIDALLVPVASGITAACTELALFKTVVSEEWRIGSPPGIGWLRSGYSNDECFVSGDNFGGTVAQGLHAILYNDVGPNYDLFVGVMPNDIIQLKGSGGNDGRYTVKWQPKAKGTAGTAASISTYGPNQASGDTFWEGNFRTDDGDWTKGTGWTIDTATGKATHSSAVAAAHTLTHDLLGMTTAGLYTIQFDVSWVSGIGVLTVDIGGGYYWYKPLDATGDGGTFSFMTNSPGATPTLTFTATRVSGTFEFGISNVYVYGSPVLYVVESFASDVGAGKDTSAVITLEQTAV